MVDDADEMPTLMALLIPLPLLLPLMPPPPPAAVAAAAPLPLLDTPIRGVVAVVVVTVNEAAVHG